MILLIDDGWSMPWAFSQQTIKQLEVIRKVVLSEVSKLNDVVINKK